MKLAILIVLLVNSSFIYSLRSFRVEATRNTKNSRVDVSTRENMLSYISPIPEVPTDGNAVKTDEQISSIGDAITDNQVPQNLDWVQVKTLFLNDPVTMKKYLMLRYKDLKFMIFKVLGLENFRKCNGKNAFENLTGTLKKFQTGCVIVKIPYKTKVNNKIEYFEIEGNYEMMAGGSNTFTSDIDLSVNFKPKDTDICIFKVLEAITIFIKNYNEKFLQLHSNTSGIAYDVNLYSMDFGNPGFASILTGLKANANEYNNFLAANRLSVLLLIYNDSLDMARQKDPSFPEKNTEIRNILTSLRTSAGTCGTAFIPDATKLFVPRSHDQNERNNNMIQHLEGTCAHPNQHLIALCNLLGANFQALEAYVPVGSIIDIMNLQGTATESPVTLGENYKIDNVLMNFAYAVEHFYEKDDYNSAYPKFSKYISRVYRAIQQLSTAEHKDCWKSLYNTLLGPNNEIFTKSDWNLANVKLLDSAIKDVVKNVADKPKITTFLIGGYNCVKLHAPTIKTEAKKKKKFF